MSDKYLEMAWLADEDPVKLAAYEKMPIVDYYVLLNKKRIPKKPIQPTNGKVKK